MSTPPRTAPPRSQRAAPAVQRTPKLSEGTKAASKSILAKDMPPPRVQLRETHIPGVFLNPDGIRVDKDGVSLSIRPLREAEAVRDEEIIGEEVKTPAQLLKRVALDPTLPLAMRLTAAVSAAPYFDRKMPTALEGGGEGSPPIKTENSVLIKNLNALTGEERKAALALLERLGVI